MGSGTTLCTPILINLFLHDSFVAALRDTDKYVRYGAAFSLAKRGWKPEGAKELSYYFVGMQEWKATKDVGKPAIPALTQSLRDRDSTIRTKAIDMLGDIRDPEAASALMQSLGDENREVRWHALLASPKCGIPLMYLPRGLSQLPAPRTGIWVPGKMVGSADIPDRYHGHRLALQVRGRRDQLPAAHPDLPRTRDSCLVSCKNNAKRSVVILFFGNDREKRVLFFGKNGK